MTEELQQIALENAVDENRKRFEEKAALQQLEEQQKRIDHEFKRPADFVNGYFQGITPRTADEIASYFAADKARKLRSTWNAPERHLRKRDEVSGAGGWKAGPWLNTVRTVNQKIGTGFLVALLGTRGGGKTQLAVEAMFRATELGKGAFYSTAMEIFIAIKSAYRPDATQNEHQAISSFCKPSLLVIDEAHERGETDWEDRILTSIIDRRYRSLKDTILIANLGPDAFDRSMGKSVVSRLSETGGVIVCNWPSFRNV